MGRYRIELIGPFGLFTPDGTRIDVSSKKSMALIALLAASPNGLRSRRWLQSMLWGSRGQEQGQASLRRELSNLVKVLQEHGAEHLLQRNAQRICLSLDHVSIDILSLGMRLPGSTLRFRGDFLEGLDLRDCDEFEEWLRLERDRVAAMQDIAIPEASGTMPDSAQVFGGVIDAAAMLANQPLSLAPKPSLGVLPFVDRTEGAMRNGRAATWLGTAMADEVAMLLSQYPQLFIVSSSAVGELAEAGTNKLDIARQLGVRYLLEGHIQGKGNRLRVGTMLLDGATGEQIWGQGFDGERDDIHALQQDIAARIAPQIWSKVDIAERNRSLRNRPLTGDNYVLYWRANALFRSWRPDDIKEAVALTEQVLDNDPTCPWAAALAAFCYGLSYLLGPAETRAMARAQAITRYQTALRYGEDNVEVIGYAVGTLVAIGGDMEVADRLVSHALTLLPAHQPTLFWGGWVDVACGRGARARDRFELALRINPSTSVRSGTMCGLGFAELAAGNVQQAMMFLEEANRSNQPFFMAPIGLCVAASLAGDNETARRHAAAIAGFDYRSLMTLFADARLGQMIVQALDAAVAGSAVSDGVSG